MDWTTFANILMGFISGGGGLFAINFIREWWVNKQASSKQGNEAKLASNKQEDEIHSNENKRALDVYREIIQEIKQLYDNLKENEKILEKQYLDTREENAKLNATILIKDDKIASLKDINDSLRAELAKTKG